MHRFQVYSNLSFLYALDMVNVSGHLNDAAVQGGQPAGQYQTDFEIDLWYDDDNNE